MTPKGGHALLSAPQKSISGSRCPSGYDLHTSLVSTCPFSSRRSSPGALSGTFPYSSHPSIGHLQISHLFNYQYPSVKLCFAWSIRSMCLHLSHPYFFSEFQIRLHTPWWGVMVLLTISISRPLQALVPRAATDPSSPPLPSSTSSRAGTTSTLGAKIRNGRTYFLIRRDS